MAGGHLVQHDAQGVDVARWGCWLAPGSLRRGIVDRAQDGALVVHWRISGRRGRDSEIDQLRSPVRRDQNVLRLDVAMEDAGGVGVVERLRDLETDIDGLVDAQWSL